MGRKSLVNARKQPKQARSRETVSAILVAASRVLAREGWAATTTTRVAEVAGVSIGSLYQYFPSKEALVGALIDEHIAKVLSLLAASTTELAGATLEDSVRALIGAILQIHAIDPQLHATLTSHFPEVEGIEKVRQLNRDACWLVQGYLDAHRARIRPIDTRRAAFVLVHAVQAVVSAAVVSEEPRLDDPELAGELARLVLGYLRREPAGSGAAAGGAPTRC
jgi:AcrR family transcriptional regulator